MSQTIFPSDLCVHFDFWNNFFSNISKGPPMIWGIFHFLNLKNNPNHRGFPLKIFNKNCIPKIKMFAFFKHISEGKIVSLKKHSQITHLLL